VLLLLYLFALYLPLEAEDILLGLALLRFVVLVASDGGAEMEGELFVDYLVHCVSKGGVSVQDIELFECDRGTVVVDGHAL
jgi:hypothetical protein